jgi:hypothetical protein
MLLAFGELSSKQRFLASGEEGSQMIKQTLRSTILALAIACSTGAFAQSFSQWNGDTHTAAVDESNVRFNSTTWQMNLKTAAGDPDLFINNMFITPGAGYNPLINMETQVGGFDYSGGGPVNHYTFGTAISGDNDWNFAGAFHNGPVDSLVADGVYDFTLGINGGNSSISNDLLASFDLHVDVIKKIDIGVVTSANPGTIVQGGTGTEVSMTVTNNMTGHNFVSSTWYVSGFGDGSGNFLDFDNFTGNWFDQVIAPGGSHSDSHSTWHAGLTTPIGTYTGDNGVCGGLHNGDFYFFNTDQQAVVNVVVPEPASFAVLGLGALALVRRRKSKKA